MSFTRVRLLLALAALIVPAWTARAAEFLPDPGFEDTRPLLPEDANSDPWRRTFFTLSPMSTDATVMPLSGVQHASLTKDHAIAGNDPVIDTTVFAGFGGALDITDFRGKELSVSVNYKVAENTVMDSSGTAPGTFIRMYLYFYGPNGGLGFGSFANADVFEAGTTDGYVTHSFTDIVPTFADPVTSISYNLAVLGQGGGSGKATVYFDDASLTAVPEPQTCFTLAGAAAICGLRSRRKR
jgi:hypothetical protein